MHKAAFCPRCASPLLERVPEHDNRPRKICPGCDYVVYVNPKIAAGTVPIVDGRVALVRRGVEPGIGRWSWPCGFVEIDETVEQAALRETHEEVGLTVELGRFLGMYSYPVRPAKGFVPTAGLVIVAWESKVLSGDLHAGDDAEHAEWWDLDAIPWDELAFDSSHRALRAVLGGS